MQMLRPRRGVAAMCGVAGSVGDILVEAGLLLLGKRYFAEFRQNAGGCTSRVRSAGLDWLEPRDVVRGDCEILAHGCVSILHGGREIVRGANTRVRFVVAGVVGESR